MVLNDDTLQRDSREMREWAWTSSRTNSSMQTWTAEGGGEIFTVTTPPPLVGTAQYRAQLSRYEIHENTRNKTLLDHHIVKPNALVFVLQSSRASRRFLDANFGGDLDWSVGH